MEEEKKSETEKPEAQQAEKSETDADGACGQEPEAGKTGKEECEKTAGSTGADKADKADKADTEEKEGEDGAQQKHREKDSKKRRERELEAKLAEAEKKLAEADEKYLRLAAEYDNFRRRSRAEREGIYGDAYAEALGKLLPTLDNLDRASQYQDPEKLADGVKLILKGLPDLLTSLGVETFGEPGDKFDPTMHSAVAMAEGTETEPGHVVAVFQKGYRRGDKILRYAAVTVASEG